MSDYLSWAGAELDPAIWQGIEYLTMEVGQPNFEAVVTVHLSRPAAGMSPESVRVSGGRRTILEDPEVIVTEGSTEIEVLFVERGDHSPYTIELLSGGDDPLHPFFSDAQFGFYVDCETGDCRPKELLPLPTPAQPPSIDMRYKDFAGFMRMLSEWVRVGNPDWADLAPASLERMLLELLAYEGDMLSYYQDRVANEAFIPTASQRHSLKQHATLLGYPVFEGEAATTILAFETTAPGFVPAGQSVENRRLHAERPVVFYVQERTRVEPRNNSSVLKPAAWPGATSAIIPAGSSRMLLRDQTPLLLPGMPFAFVQGNYSQVVRLTQVRLVELPGWVAVPDNPPSVAVQPLTEIEFEPPLAAELHPWDAQAQLQIYANLAPASHGDRRISWINPPASPGPNDPAPASHDEVLPLNRHNSIVVAVPRGGVMVSLLRAVEVPEGPVIHKSGSDGGSAPVIELFIDGEQWIREEHLHQSQSFDTHFVATADNSGRLWLQFGDGIRGREIEVDPATRRPLAAIRMVYRVAEPLDGNCARDTLTEAVRPPEAGYDALGISQITNVISGSGGKRKDTLDEIRSGIPMSLKHGDLQRAVPLRDYATIARNADGVSRAAAKHLVGPFNTVLILVDSKDDAGLSEELRSLVSQRIEATRMAGREHFVAPADYVPLRVEMAICVQPGFPRHQVRDRVLAELRPGSDDHPGYFHPDNLTFGQDLESGDLTAFVQSIPGVRAVKVTAFCRLSTPVISVEDRIDFGYTEVARLDADEDFPENGIFRLRVVGLDAVEEDLFDIDYAAGVP